jgi:hypothetical protein
MAQAVRLVTQGAQQMSQGWTTAVNQSTQASGAWRQSLLSLSQSVPKLATQQAQLTQAIMASTHAIQQQTVAMNASAKANADASQSVTAFFAAYAGAAVLKNFISDTALTAARTETLGVVLMQVAKNAGVTALEAGTARDRIKELGITTQEASIITARFIQNNLNLTDALKLARVAQDASVIANQTGSQALAGLLHGILTLQPEVIRTYGLIVNLEQAYKIFADTHGRVPALLSGQEKQQIALNAVLEAAQQIAGSYAAAMETVGRQIGSLNRLFEESQNIIGAHYLPILSRVVQTITDLLIGFQKLPAPIQTVTAALLGAAAAMGALALGIAAVTRAAQALAISALFTGWGPVILALGAATAGAIALAHALRSVGEVDPATALKQSQTAIDERIRSTENLLSAQRSSLQQMQEQLAKTPESTRGAEAIARQTTRVKELEAAVEALRQTREQLAKPVPLPPPKPPPTPPDGAGKALAAEVAAREKAMVQLTQAQIRQEAAALEETQALRAQALEQDYADAMAHTVKTKADQLDVERAFAIRRLDIQRLSALEEARLQEQAAVKIRDAKLAAIAAEEAAARAARGAPGQTAAEQEAASKRLAALAVERQTVVVDAEQAMAKAREQRAAADAAYEKGTTQLVRNEKAEQLKITAAQAQREAELRQGALSVQQETLSAERQLVEAHVEGLVLTREEGFARIGQIEQNAYEVRRAQLDAQLKEDIRRMEDRLTAEGVAADQIAEIHVQMQAQANTRLAALDVEHQAQQQHHLNALQEGWIQWVKDVEGALGDFLFDWFSGQIDSIEDLLDGLKNYFFRILADMIAQAATKAIIIPVVQQFLGGVGGAAGAAQAAGAVGGLFGRAGGGGGLADMLLQGLGLAQLFGPTGTLGQGFTWLSDSLMNAASQLSTFFGGPTFGTAGPGVTLGPGIMPWNPLMMLGGLAGIGGGIYSALGARGIGGQAGGAIGAAGGALAIATQFTTALAPIFGPIGLALAAIGPLLGSLIDSLGAPAGPRAVIGGFGGVGVRAEGGRLALEGALTSRIQRGERLEGFDLAAVQDQLSQTVTNLLTGMLTAINEVALTPETLLGPTQDALNAAMAAVKPINSSNRQNLARDMQEQVKFVGVQMASFFLDPLNAAAEQLQGAELETQIQRFGPTIAGMSQVFNTMNAQIEELSQAANTDVLRQLSAVRNRVEDFGNQLVEVAGQLATEIADGVTRKGQEATEKLLTQSLEVQALTAPRAFTERLQAIASLQQALSNLGATQLDFSAVGDQLNRIIVSVIEDAFTVIDTAVTTGAFDEALRVVLAIPDAVIALNPQLASFRALAAAFAPLVNQLTQDIAGLEAVVTPLSDRIADSATNIRDLEQAIHDVGADVQVALPLYDQYRQAILENATLQIQAIQEIQQAWEAAMSQIESAITALEATVLSVEQQMSLATDDLAQSARDYADAVAAGDMVAAIQAIQAYAEGIQEIADLQIRLIQAQRQAYIDAQQAVVDAVQQQIDAIQGVIDAIDDHIDSIQEQIDLTRQQIDAAQEAVQAQQELVSSLEAEARARQEAVETLRRQIEQLTSLRERAGGIIRGAVAPTAQAEAIRAQIAATQAALQGATGEDAIKHLERLIQLNEELKALGEQTHQLGLIKEALDNLAVIQQQLNDRIAEGGAALTVAEQQLAAANEAVEVAKKQLDALVAEVERLEAILKGQEDLLAAWQEIRDIQQKELDAWQEILQVQQAELERIQASTYWDEQIAKVNVDTLIQLKSLQDTLIALQGPTTWEDQILAIQRGALGQLGAIVEHLRALYYAAATGSQYEAPSLQAQQSSAAALNRLTFYNLALPVPMTVTNFHEAPRQHGGLVGLASGSYYAQGGLVPVMAEPGERVFASPMTFAQQGALTAMNTAFPRFGGGGFTVPGRGSGDTVPMLLSPGSFVLNRRASGMLGYQDGGGVGVRDQRFRIGLPETGEVGNVSSVSEVHIHVDLRGAHFSTAQDLERLKGMLAELQRRGMRRT